MKSAILMLVALLPWCSQAQITNPAPYCAAEYFTNYNMFERITVNGSSQDFGPMGVWSDESTYLFYNNYSIPSVNPGQTIDVSIDPYAVQDMEPIYFALFIDWNNNNAFEGSEIALQNSNTTMAALPTFNEPVTTITGQIVVPANAAAGNHRARLMRDGFGAFNYDNSYQISACVDVNQFGYGCTFDFNIPVAGNSAGLAELDKPEFIICNNQIGFKEDLKSVCLCTLSGSILTFSGGSALAIKEVPTGYYILVAENKEGQQFSYKIQL